MCVCVLCVCVRACVCVCVCKLLPQEKAKGQQKFCGDLGVQGFINISFFSSFFSSFFFFFFQIGHPWPIRAGFFGIFRGKWGGGVGNMSNE